MRRNSALAALADIVGVLFCVIGRRSHAEGLTAAGVAETAWPFLRAPLSAGSLHRAGAGPRPSFPPGWWSGCAPSRSECSRAEPLPRASPSASRGGVSRHRGATPRMAGAGCGHPAARAQHRPRSSGRSHFRRPHGVPASPRRPQAATRSSGAAAGGVLAAQPRRRAAKYCPAQTTRIEYVDDKGQWVQKDIGTGANEVIMNGELPGVEYLPGPPTGQAAPGHPPIGSGPTSAATSCTNTMNQPAGRPRSRCCPRAGSVGRAPL